MIYLFKFRVENDKNYRNVHQIFNDHIVYNFCIYVMPIQTKIRSRTKEK